MNRKLFITTFMLAQICFIFLYIHKQSQLIKLSFDKQKFEKRKSNLIEQKQRALQQLQAAQNRAHIKEYALKELKMTPVRIDQIKSNV